MSPTAEFAHQFPGITWTAQVTDGTIVSASANMEREIGISNIVGRKWSDVFGPFEAKGHAARAQNIQGGVWRVWAWPSENGIGPVVRGAAIRIF